MAKNRCAPFRADDAKLTPGIPLSCSEIMLQKVWNFNICWDMGLDNLLVVARIQGWHPPGRPQRSDGRVGSAADVQKSAGVYSDLL